MSSKLFRKMRGLNDVTLGKVLENHAGVLGATVNATGLLLRERRLLLVLHVVEAVVIVWLLLR